MPEVVFLAAPGTYHLQQLLMPNPAATFLMRVGNSQAMEPELSPHDILIVDRSQIIKPPQLVVAIAHDELTVRLLVQTEQHLLLQPLHPDYKSLPITPDDIWGVVIWSLHPLRQKREQPPRPQRPRPPDVAGQHPRADVAAAPHGLPCDADVLDPRPPRWTSRPSIKR